MIKYQNENKLTEVQIVKDASFINHLLFADDCLFFVKPELNQLRQLKEILADYERVAGQKANYNKSEFTGSNNIHAVMMRLCGDFLGKTFFSGWFQEIFWAACKF